MKNPVSRCFWFIFGVLINSFGVSLITKAALGTSPITSVAYVLSLRFEPSLGLFTFYMNVVFILVQIVLLRRDFKPVQLLQLGVNVIFSFAIDVSLALLENFTFETIPVQVFSLLLGCLILGFGISVEVAPDVLMVPGEGIVRAISTVSKIRFGTVKLCFDTTLVIIAGVMSFSFWGHLEGLGIGTVVSAFIVGPICNLLARHLPLIHHIRSLSE